MSKPANALEQFLSQFRVETSDLDGDAAFSNTENRSVVPEGKRECPICDLEMETHVREGVKIDVCAGHGVWLDDGELEIICRRMDFTRERIVQAKVNDAYLKGLRAGRCSS